MTQFVHQGAQVFQWYRVYHIPTSGPIVMELAEATLDFIRPITRIRFLASQDQIGSYISQGRIWRCSWVLDDLTILKMINIEFFPPFLLGNVWYGSDWVWGERGFSLLLLIGRGGGQGISPIGYLKAPACF